MDATARPGYLEPSDLGSKSHWDDVYEREIRNHEADPTDEGTIWFDDSGAEEKVIEFLETLELGSPDDGHATPAERSDIRIADIGTGNGHLLFALRDNDWRAQMVGLDYSPASVELCRRIAAERASEGAGEGSIDFQVFDILHGVPGTWATPRFDVVLDKGTFDAISLNSEAASADARRGCEVYAEKVAALLKPGSGYLVITSCNWTTGELERWFDIPQLSRFKTIAFPSFQFGGMKGQTVSAVCFRRTEAEG